MSEQPRKQRAKNPGFEAWKAQYLAFKASPEGQEANRPVTKFLDEIGSRTWGYIVYRTIFNPDSDSLVSLAIEKLNALVKKEVESDLVGKDFDKSINQKVLEQWRLEIVDGRGTGTGGASLEDARQMFLERMRQEGVEGRGVCLLLDEKVVTSLMNGDLEGEFLPVLKGGSYVTVVDGQWTPGQGDPEYPGWMKVNAQRLMRVFSMLNTMSLYQNWCGLSLINIIVALEKERDVQDPILKKGAAISLRFLEHTRETVLEIPRSQVDRAIILNRNNAAHQANGMFHAALFRAGFVSDEYESAATEAFEALYDIGPYEFEDYSKNIRRLANCQSTIRALKSINNGDRYIELRAAGDDVESEILRRQDEYDFDFSWKIEDLITQFESLTEEVVEIDRSRYGRRR